MVLKLLHIRLQAECYGMLSCDKKDIMERRGRAVELRQLIRVLEDPRPGKSNT